MSMLIVRDYPIKPSNIDLKESLFTVFRSEVLIKKAKLLIEFFVARGDEWCPFAYESINAFALEQGVSDFDFTPLVDMGFIVRHPAGYCVTHQMVAGCFLAAPKLK